MQDELVVDVLGVAEQGDVHAVCDNLYLLPHGRCEFIAIVDSSRRFSDSIGDKSVKLLSDLLVLWRLEPDLVLVLTLRKTS
jgi:phosphohistidine phosphatase SixA